MKLSDFVISEAIVANLKAADRDGAIREMIDSLAETGALPKAAVEPVVDALVKREKNGSTGFGKGVAVPHAKHAQVKKMIGTVGRSEQGIDFASLDHQPVHIVFLLLSPLSDDETQRQQHTQQHLQAMNIIFTNLQDDAFRRFLRQSGTRQAIVELLEEFHQGK